MGAKDSKPSCISYEDAIKRVSDTELKRIKEAFKRSAGTGNTCLSKSAFIQDVLCEGVPLPIAECLYAACGGTQKGISFKDLICGLVLLAKGSQEEKIRFLFNLYCNESGTHIIKHDFIRALQTELPQQTVINNNNWVSLFGQTDRVTFEQFKSWITIHRQGTVLGRWLLVEPVVNLSSELETPTFFQSLAGVTHLEEQDIRELEKVFWRLKGSAVTGQLDLESVSPLLSPPVPRNALAGVFNAFDENRDGHIDFKELCCGVSAACRGPSVERSKFCFKVFDTDRDGVLSHEELRQMVEVLLFVAQESNNFAFFRNMTHDAVMKELAERAEKKASEGGSIHRDDAFVFTQEDFLMWSIESSLNLVAQFLELLFEVCHVVFGLRPQCRHMEYDIVKGWLSREVKRGYRVGQFWYLISSEWWQNWLQHTQNVPPSSCSHCKVSRNGSSGATATGFDEAVVCDESFTSNSTESMGDLLTAGDSTSLGSCSSGISYGRTVSVAPGPIDNRSLIAPTIYKNVPTLTGEGGRLKRDSTLAQHRDFELVPDSLWKALALWYQGPLPLPRQVIQPPGNPEVEVELYPLNLRILRHHYPQNQTASQQQQQNTLGSNAWGIVSGGYGVLNTPSGITGNVTASSLASSLQPPKKYLAYMAAFSKLATVKQVCEFLCQRLKLRQEDVRLWHVLGGSQSGNSMAEMPYLLEEDKATLQELMINDNDQLLLECRNKDLTWPEELSALSISGANPVAVGQERRSTVASIHSVHPAGATGLHNLGNTCFMNAALQVMFNTQPLARYFQQDMHLYELNTSNKLGTKGQLAMRYSELLKEVWTASARSIAPLKLRFCVTKNAPQFAGGGQHDSQEFLEWLLDALHEDLNRVMEKSYSELKDSDGRADCVVAAEAWSQHNARNQSIVIDLFYGQLKSKVTCLGCGKDSVRFDPFSLLSLPLPVENYTYCEVLVIFLDGSVPIKYGLRLNSDAKYMELKMELSHVCNLDPDLMLCCEILESQVRTILQDDQKVKASTATELYVYELPKMGGNERSLCNSEIGLSIEKGLKDIQRHQADNYQSTISSTVSSITTSSEDTASGQPLTGGSTASGDNAHDEGTSTQPQATAVRKKSAEIERKSSKVSRCLGNTLCMPQTLLCFKQMDMGTSPDNAFVPPNYGPNKTISTTNLLTSDRNSSGGGDHVTGAMKDNDSDASDGCDRCASAGGGGGGSFDGPPQGGFPPNGLRRMTRQKASRYLIAVHRQLSRQDTYFLSYHKTKPHLFGTPLLIPCHEGSTNKDLYCAVWLQVARLLSPLPPTPPDRANHATDCDDSLGYEFPFTLRAVASGGRICALCPWFRFCRGCEIPCNNDSLVSGLMATQSIQMSSTASTPIMSHRDQAASIHRRTQSEIGMCGDQALSIDLSCISIAIDWDPTALHLRYQSTREKVWTMHESVTVCRRQQTEPVDLNHCLRAFTSEEKLEQWYYCSHCKGKQPATKKLQIWKLPPILIIHLKRFNYVNNKWVKSQKVVNFPYDEFDPTPYLASVPQETILRHRELYAGSGTPCEERIDENSVFSSSGANKMGAEGRISCIENGNEGGGTMLRQERRKRLISGSLTKTPVNDEDLVDFHKHKLKSGVDPLDLKYQLYAVVSHSGMLNGGHYISYAANPNGSWFCYNDSSCREIPHRPQIDPGSAYLLFYERKELDYSPYLPKVSGRPIANGAMDIDDESELRKMCTIA
ncbi:ubiquitin carboxyl-terminal hydrolase 32 isoform X2 [Lutzomyia longipalpis]|uniref:ubiquitin carboxyl-terminal hydrolase 32 isoform X2 n=1 Tax=Lutzomyia longipalpis TaxID=7200 RepID=UPI0024844F66|nr:ubiquitin carboxyl-terminal hydrolase 32 isoform X2 [Lutzomyia longipalpis]